MSGGHTVLLSSQAEVVNSLMDDDGSVEHTGLPTQLHQVVLYPDDGVSILVRRHVAQVPHVSVHDPRRPVVVAEGVEMPACPRTVVWQVPRLVDVEAVLSRAQTRHQPWYPDKQI